MTRRTRIERVQAEKQELLNTIKVLQNTVAMRKEEYELLDGVLQKEKRRNQEELEAQVLRGFIRVVSSPTAGVDATPVVWGIVNSDGSVTTTHLTVGALRLVASKLSKGVS